MALGLAGLWAMAGVAADVPADPSAATLARDAAGRHPQPVRVGQLIGEAVLQPVPSKRLLGRVRAVVRTGAGRTDVVVAYGGVLGFGTRPIAVPVDAMVLLGRTMEIVSYTPADLERFPTWNGAGTPIPPDETIKVGLAKPSH